MIEKSGGLDLSGIRLVGIRNIRELVDQISVNIP